MSSSTKLLLQIQDLFHKPRSLQKYRNLLQRLVPGLCSLFLLDTVLLQRAHESLLFLVSLEATMTKLAACVDELEVGLLQCLPTSVHLQGLKPKQKG